MPNDCIDVESQTVELSAVPTAEMVNERWMNALSQTELWTFIWLNSPQLAKNAGTRVEELMMPIEMVQRRSAKNW